MADISAHTLSPWASQGSNELRERLRWVMVALDGGACPFRRGGPRQHLSRQLIPANLVHFGLAMAVLLYNLFSSPASRKPGFGENELTNRLRYGQVPIDLRFSLYLSTLRRHTSPVFVLYFLYIFVGLAILPPAEPTGSRVSLPACLGHLPSGSLRSSTECRGHYPRFRTTILATSLSWRPR